MASERLVTANPDQPFSSPDIDSISVPLTHTSSDTVTMYGVTPFEPGPTIWSTTRPIRIEKYEEIILTKLQIAALLESEYRQVTLLNPAPTLRRLAIWLHSLEDTAS